MTVGVRVGVTVGVVVGVTVGVGSGWQGVVGLGANLREDEHGRQRRRGVVRVCGEEAEVGVRLAAHIREEALLRLRRLGL